MAFPVFSAPPCPITAQHDTTAFHCAEPILNQWLQQRALKNEQMGASRTYVLCVEQAVVAYYALAAGSVERALAPGSFRRGMPDPIPVMVLGRLAVDSRYTGNNLGTAMLRDAVLRTRQVAKIVGIRALLVHALNEGVTSFYTQRGFIASPFDSLTLLLSMKQISGSEGD